MNIPHVMEYSKYQTFTQIIAELSEKIRWIQKIKEKVKDNDQKLFIHQDNLMQKLNTVFCELLNHLLKMPKYVNKNKKKMLKYIFSNKI